MPPLLILCKHRVVRPCPRCALQAAASPAGQSMMGRATGVEGAGHTLTAPCGRQSPRPAVADLGWGRGGAGGGGRRQRTVQPASRRRGPPRDYGGRPDGGRRTRTVRAPRCRGTGGGTAAARGPAVWEKRQRRDGQGAAQGGETKGRAEKRKTEKEKKKQTTDEYNTQSGDGGWWGRRARVTGKTSW